MPSLSLYTSGPMLNLAVTTITAAGGAEAVGFPIENAFDHNPDTFWKASTVDGATIDIDLGIAYTVDAMSTWVHNVSEFSFAAGHRIELLSDDNDDGNYSAVTELVQLFPGLTSVTSSPSNLFNTGTAATPVSKRFWRLLYFGNPTSTVAEFSGIWLHRERAISKSSQLPRNDTIQYFNQVSRAAGGREFFRGVNSTARDMLPRTYLIEETDWTALRDAFDDSKGRRLPMVYIESGEDTRLVRFGSDTLSQNEISHQIFNPTFQLVQVPFIAEGETF